MDSTKDAALSADLVFVCQCLGPGGIQRVVSTLANEWSSEGRKICIITRDEHCFYVLREAVVRVVMYGNGVSLISRLILRAIGIRDAICLKLARSPLLDSAFARAVGNALNRLFLSPPHRVYLCVMFAYEAWILRRVLQRIASPVVVSMGTPRNLLTVLASRGLGRRIVVSERGDSRAMQGGWVRRQLIRTLYKQADAVTANTRALVNEMAAFVSPEKLTFVPNPLAHVGPHASSAPGVPTVLSVGRHVPEKAPEVLVDAFAFHMNGANPPARLVMLGDGPLQPELKRRTERLGIARDVEWHGMVKDPLPFYRAASVFVLVSRTEGMPNALLEAMSCGVPVIVSDSTPGLLELVEDGVTGLVVPVDDAKAVARALGRLLADAALRKRLGEAGRQRVAEYDLPHALAVWESVVGMRHGAATVAPTASSGLLPAATVTGASR